MVDGTSGWGCGVKTAAGCVSGGFCAEGLDTDVVGTDGCGRGGSVGGSGLGSSGGDGEWSGVIGVVGMWLGDGSSISRGEPSGMSENSSSISPFISCMFSSSSFPVSSLAGGGLSMSVGMMDVVRLATTSAVLLGFLVNVDFKVATFLSLWGIWPD